MLRDSDSPNLRKPESSETLSKIDAIKEYERPKCIKKLRSFLGLTNYYRKFINNYSDYSKNLEKLCGSNQKKLVWTDECEKAFQSLKEKLINSPVLAFPDLSREFILDTDASFDRIELYYLNWMIMETKESLLMDHMQ